MMRRSGLKPDPTASTIFGISHGEIFSLNTNKPIIIDTHAHLEGEEYAADCNEMIARAVEAGVQRIVTCGTTVDSSGKAVALTEKYSQVYATVGIHPQEIAGATHDDIRRIAELAKHPKVVGLGEMGLDFHRSVVHKDEQIEGLKRQLELASELKLPVVLHTRKAVDEVIEILKEWLKKSPADSPGVIHCFQENETVAKTFLEMGFYLAFGGYISYPNSHLEDVINSVPKDRLLVETDSPYLPPQKYRGQRNEPAYIALTVERMAVMLGITPEQTADLTTENAMRLFNLNKSM
jgi:TatD DNase family protein